MKRSGGRENACPSPRCVVAVRMDGWPPLRETNGLAVGILIVVSMAIGVIFLAQSLGASGHLLIATGGITSLRCHRRGVEVRNDRDCGEA